jgi:hypothetical protein
MILVVHPGSGFLPIPRIPDPGVKALKSNSNPIMVGTLARYWYPTPLIFLHIPDPGVKKAPDPGSATLVASKNGKRCKQHLESLSPPPPRPPNSELGFAPQNCFKSQTLQDAFREPHRQRQFQGI